MDGAARAFLKRSLFSCTKNKSITPFQTDVVLQKLSGPSLLFHWSKRKRHEKKKDGKLTQLVYVDGLAAHAFPALAQSLDLNQIVVAGGEAELGCGFVGEDGVDFVVAMLLHHHLGGAEKIVRRTNKPGDKSELCKGRRLTAYPVTFDSISVATTGSQCRVSVEPIMVHCMLSGARSGAGIRTSEVNYERENRSQHRI